MLATNNNGEALHRLGLLSSIVALLFVSGCSEAYNAEKLYWKAKQFHKPIIANLEAATPEQYEAAITAYDLVVEETPGTNWAAQSHLAVGSLYALQKKYVKSRDAYGLVLQNYNNYKELCLRSRFSIAKTYEIEKNWDAALKMYQDIATNHTWSLMGLQVPMYVAAIHESRQETKEAKRSYEKAVRTYVKLIPQAPTAAVASQIKGYLALSYQRLGDWDKAVKTLEELASIRTGGTTNRPLVLLTLGSIYSEKVKDSLKAKVVYSRLLEEFPDHPFGKVARAQLERFGVNLPPVSLTPTNTTLPIR